MRHTLITTLVFSTLLAAASAAAAQRRPPLPGALVRVARAEAAGPRIQGRLVRLTPDSLVVSPAATPDTSLALPLDGVASLEAGVRDQSPERGRMMLLFAGAGAAPGVLYYRQRLRCAACPGGDEGSQSGAVALTVLGGMLGGWIGYLATPASIRWTPVNLPAQEATR